MTNATPKACFPDFCGWPTSRLAYFAIISVLLLWNNTTTTTLPSKYWTLTVISTQVRTDCSCFDTVRPKTDFFSKVRPFAFTQFGQLYRFPFCFYAPDFGEVVRDIGIGLFVRR